MKNPFDVAKKYLEKAEPEPQCQAASDLPLRAWVIEEVWDHDKCLAVKICSAVIEALFWLVLDRSFTPDDELAVYHPEELQWLRDKGPETLKKVHETKLVFPGVPVVQE